CNMQEIFTYPWMSDEYVEAILQSTEGLFELSAPPSPTERFIRSSLLPNMAKAVNLNLRYYKEFSLFETALTVKDADYTTPYYEHEKLPAQTRTLAGSFVGSMDDVVTLFRQAKGVVENMSRYTHMEGFTFKKEEKPVWADDVVWLNVYVGEEKIGDLALLSKKAAMACGIKNSAVMLFELSIDGFKPFTSRTNEFTHLAEYPMIDYDISLLFDSTISWAEIQKTALGCKGQNQNLQDVTFFEEYKGKHVPEGKKSVTMRLVIGSKEKTLKADEIEACVAVVVKKLTKKLNAETR
ncbi:MAG: phenylalanine--tRNA ligase subunit beta, partial [Firmicutes bacterium]|nr:phenylalanine--tRNA ligase subunit beta [Bacillota bacterium]